MMSRLIERTLERAAEQIRLNWMAHRLAQQEMERQLATNAAAMRRMQRQHHAIQMARAEMELRHQISELARKTLH